MNKKIVYDGMMSRDKCVKDECVSYLKFLSQKIINTN